MTTISGEQLGKLAGQIKDLLERHDLWEHGNRLYFNNKAVCAALGVIDDIDVTKYHEYSNPETITMMLYGKFQEIINYSGGPILDEFNRLINEYGFYYEQGTPRDLALFKRH